MRRPTDQDALRAVHAGLGVGVCSVERLAVGLRHYVYAITTEDGREVVARLATSDSTDDLVGGVYWHERLRGVGAPLADLLRADLTPASGFPYMLLARLPGRDLGLVYGDLTRAQRLAIAERIVAIQRAVATLPHARGFGFTRSYDDPALHPFWLDVV